MKSQVRVCVGLLAVLVTGLLGTATAGASVTHRLALAPQESDAFDFGQVAVGQTSSQVFTLSTTRWEPWSGRIRLNVFGSSAFTITSDGCSGTFLSPRNQSCQVTVQYAPKTAGNTDRAALRVTGLRWFWWHRWHWSHRHATGVDLSGTGAAASTGGGGGGGNATPANLQLTPGTPTGTTGSTNSYSYDFGQIKTVSKSFTVTNVGGTTSLELVLDGWVSGGYSLSSDTCSGHTLAANATCTFTETWNAGQEPMCDAVGTPVGLEPAIDSADESTTYVAVDLTAKCAR